MQQILANPLGALAQADEMMQGKRRARLADLQLQAAEKRQQLGTLLPKAMTGDQQATSQVAEIDPELFLKLDENRKEALRQQISENASMLAGVLNAPAPLRAAAYRQVRDIAIRERGATPESMPEMYDEGRIIAQVARARKVEDILNVQQARPSVLSPGAQLRGPDGVLLAENTNVRPGSDPGAYYGNVVYVQEGNNPPVAIQLRKDQGLPPLGPNQRYVATPNVMLKPEIDAATVDAKGNAEYVQGSLAAAQALPTLYDMRDLLKDVESGGFEAHKQRVADYFGVADATAGDFNALAYQQAIDTLSQFKGATTDFEFNKIIDETVANLSRSKSVNYAILDRTIKKLNSRLKEAQKVAKDTGASKATTGRIERAIDKSGQQTAAPMEDPLMQRYNEGGANYDMEYDPATGSFK